jgi:hypothetical protein
MVKCGVLFEVRTEFLNTIYTKFGFIGLIYATRKGVQLRALVVTVMYIRFQLEDVSLLTSCATAGF